MISGKHLPKFETFHSLIRVRFILADAGHAQQTPLYTCVRIVYMAVSGLYAGINQICGRASAWRECDMQTQCLNARPLWFEGEVGFYSKYREATSTGWVK